MKRLVRLIGRWCVPDSAWRDRGAAALVVVVVASCALPVAAAKPPHAAAGNAPCGKPNKPACPPTPTPAVTPTPTATAVPTPTPTIAPTPTPTLAPTPTPTLAPTPTPTIAPTPTAPPSCPTTLQAAVNATPTGGTLTLGACTFHEAVTVTRAMTITGPATITGDGIRQQWLNVSGSGVTLDGLTMTNAAQGPAQCGSLDVSGSLFTARNLTLVHGCEADIRLWGATSARVENVDASDGSIGLLAFGAHNAVITGGRYHDNRRAGSEQGGMKLCASMNATYATQPATITGVEADHNVGAGIWLDCYVNGSLISGNTVHDNTRSGIHDEISDSVQVRDNVVYRNGTEPNGNAYSQRCGIFVSSSSHTTVAGNTAAWNGNGDPSVADICFVSQNRELQPHTGNSATGNVLRSAVAGVRSFTDFGDPNVPVMSPNTRVADTDSRVAVYAP